MRHASIIRIAVPRKNVSPPEPDLDAAKALLGLVDFCRTAVLPLLDQSAHDGMSPAERRVLCSLPSRKPVLARDLARQLGMDEGYLSRTIRQLVSKGLINKQDGDDRRQLTLTATGRLQRLRFKRAKTDAMDGLLLALSRDRANELAKAASTLEELLRHCVAEAAMTRPSSARPGQGCPD